MTVEDNDPLASKPAVPEGFALVPLILTREMDEVLSDEGWQWEDLLAAAEAITEEQYNQISTAPAQSCGGAEQADEAVTDGFEVALNALAEYQHNWDTGLPAEYANPERIAMECAVEAVREALNDARDAARAKESKS